MDLICPYCKAENDSFDYDFMIGEIAYSFWARCGSCKKDFNVEPVVSYSFETSKIGDD